MAQTAQQLSDTSHMRIRSATFVEDSPLGKYSEVQAVQPLSAAAAALRTYWRGQCSMRIEAIWGPGTSARALQFLDSLHEVKETAADKAGAAASEAAPDTSVPDAAAEKTDANDLDSQLKRRQMELTSAAAAVSPAAAEAPSSAAAPGGALPADAALRLRQLKKLQDSGLITKEEYETKRQAILKVL